MTKSTAKFSTVKLISINFFARKKHVENKDKGKKPKQSQLSQNC